MIETKKQKHFMLKCYNPKFRKLETIPQMCPLGFRLFFQKKAQVVTNMGKKIERTKN